MEKSAEEVRCGNKHALGVGKGRGAWIGAGAEEKGGIKEGVKEKK